MGIRESQHIQHTVGAEILICRRQGRRKNQRTIDPICSIVTSLKMLARILNSFRSRRWDLWFFDFFCLLQSDEWQDDRIVYLQGFIFGCWSVFEKSACLYGSFPQIPLPYYLIHLKIAKDRLQKTKYSSEVASEQGLDADKHSNSSD